MKPDLRGAFLTLAAMFLLLALGLWYVGVYKMGQIKANYGVVK